MIVYFFIFSAVVVGFEEDDIQTSEGISAEVCVRKNGLVDFDVMLVVNVTGGNASRELNSTYASTSIIQIRKNRGTLRSETDLEASISS